MILDILIEWNSTIDHATHQVNAATWRIHLGAKFHIGRAGRGAETTMHTIEKEFVINTLPNARL